MFGLSERESEILCKYEFMANTSRDGYWVLSRTGEIRFANAVIAGMYGYSREEMQGKHLRDIEVEDEETMRSHLARIRSQGHDRFESLHFRKDRSFFNAERSHRALRWQLPHPPLPEGGGELKESLQR